MTTCDSCGSDNVERTEENMGPGPVNIGRECQDCGSRWMRAHF